MEPKIRFVHLRVYDSLTDEFLARSGVTIGFREIELNVIEYAVSYCSPNDVYNKSIGRTLVTERLENPDTRYDAEVTFEQMDAICRCDTLRYVESYGELIEEVSDLLGVVVPAAHLQYDWDFWADKAKLQELVPARI